MSQFEKLREALTPEQQIELDKCKERFVETKIEDVKCCEILCDGFVWSRTPQGFKYWNDIHDDLFEKGL